MNMRLYGASGSCSLAAHIALREAGVNFDYVSVDLRSRKAADGRDLAEINAKGYVPVLQFNDGQILTEVPVVLQYIADQSPEKGLLPKAATMSRYRVQEWLTFINSELHKTFGPLFIPGASEEAKTQCRAQLLKRLNWVDEQLAGRSFLVDGAFSIADIYLFVVVGWTKFVGLDIPEMTHLNAYLGRIAGRTEVQGALRAEGLIK